jgi:hypothetical protein
LSRSIGLVDHPALRTGPAGVAWIKGDDRDAGKLRFICREPAKLGKRPPMQTAALRLAGLNPVANMRDVFDRNHAAGAFGVRNSFLRYVVVHVLAKAGLLPAQSLKAALCSFGAAALQAGMAARELLSNALDFSIGKGSPFAVIGNVYDAEINALERLRCRFAPGQGRHKHSQDTTCHAPASDRPRPCEGKQGALTVTADDRNLRASTKRPDAHRVVAGETEDPVVARLSGVLAKPDDAVTVVGLLRGVGSGDLGNAAHRGRCRQPERLSDIGIDELAQVKLTSGSAVMAALPNLVAGCIAALTPVAQRLRLFCRRCELDVCHKFHAFNSRNYRLTFNPQPRKGRAASPT